MATVPDPSAPVDDDNCMLLGPTALLVQGVMGIIVLLSLVYKRHREKPKRAWRIWSFDVSKQVFGQILVHILNVGLSALVSQPESGNNPCTAYFMNVTFDVTLGVVIIWAVLHGVTNVLTNKFHFNGYVSGSYGTPPSIRFWIRQTAVYVFALCVMKFVVLIILAGIPSVFRLGDWLLSWTEGNIHLQVVFVMGLYPIVMNILQFWLIDSIVKASNFLEVFDTTREEPGVERSLLADGDHHSDFSDDDDRPPASQSSNDLERQAKPSSPVSVSSRPISPRGISSEVKSVRSTSSMMRKNGKDRSLSVLVHDYPPPSRSQSPVPSPSGSRPSSFIRKRSPPPSPSPVATPSNYGSVADSPRLKPIGDPSDISGWEWDGDPDDKKSKLSGIARSKSGKPPNTIPARRESWSLPSIHSPPGTRDVMV